MLAAFVAHANLTPYDIATRTGELKNLLVTQSPDGELMVRFVLRSQEPVTRIRKHLPALLDALPSLRVASVNLLPDHKAVLEGEREIHLTAAETLRMRVNGIDLHLRPQSFFQTNTRGRRRAVPAGDRVGRRRRSGERVGPVLRGRRVRAARRRARTGTSSGSRRASRRSPAPGSAPRNARRTASASRRPTRRRSRSRTRRPSSSS